MTELQTYKKLKFKAFSIAVLYIKMFFFRHFILTFSYFHPFDLMSISKMILNTHITVLISIYCLVGLF